jgi:hypothetical protein
VLGHINARPESGIEVGLTESLLQTEERGLPGTMAGSNLVQVPFILERIDEAVSKRMRLPSFSMRAENPQSRVRVGLAPKAS